MSGYVPVLLITANVGSIFEEPSVMLNIWTEEFLSTIARLDPKFIALHCQEVGGKNYEQSMRHVEYFVRLLMSSEELRLFDKVRVFLDEDFSSAEHFTALGNFYFVHESLKDVLLWDFKESTFIPVTGKDVHSGNIEAVTTKEKAKFPQDFFPECKWSRKGFLRTRWSISGTVFDLINIHLFHDASNFVAMETFPSVYSKTRRRALEHTLDRFHNDQYPNVPYFLFGDFNFRTDTAGVIKKLTEDTQESKLPSKNNFSKLQFHNKDDHLILTLGKKEFSHCEHQHVFMKNSGQWLREYDRELEDFEGRLLEFPINFLPSYPFEENIKEGSNYMQTRVPAWCDRILLSPTAKSLAQNASTPGAVEYGIIGPTTCMGDHKPVYLRIVLLSDAGTVNCCHLANTPQYCFKVPDSYVDTLSMLPDCRSYLSKPVHIDHSANLLHAVPVKHDPYTPDSMDSPSPRALVVSGEVPDVDLLDDYNEDADYNQRAFQLSSANKRINTAVSPALLKSKLELIVQSKKQRDLVGCEFVSKVNKVQIRKSPSECDLHSLKMVTKDKDPRNTSGLRRNRSNSDISRQRSYLLTRAWLQGKGHQAYDSFYSNITQKSCCSLNSLEINYTTPDLVIPRIAIINASNFESNESSVHLHDDRHSLSSNTRLSTYSENRTKTISGETSSPEKSDEIYDRIYKERENMERENELEFEKIEDKIIQDEDGYPLVDENFDRRTSLIESYSISTNRNKSLEKLGKDSLTEELTLKPQCTLFTEKSISRENNNQYASKDETREIFKSEELIETAWLKTTDIDLARKNEVQMSKSGEKNAEYEGKFLDKTKAGSTPKVLGPETSDANKTYVEDNTIDNSKASVMPKMFESQRGDVNVINENINTYNINNVGLTNEIDVLRSESRQDILGSRNTTRSNSTQSQDGNIKLSLTARKVTEKCKNDIAREKRKCKKCCCVVA